MCRKDSFSDVLSAQAVTEGLLQVADKLLRTLAIAFCGVRPSTHHAIEKSKEARTGGRANVLVENEFGVLIGLGTEGSPAR